MVSTVIQAIENTKSDVDVIFTSWYKEIMVLAEQIGVAINVPRKTSYKGIEPMCQVKHLVNIIKEQLPFLFLNPLSVK